ncbi:hypothetical protein LguiB_000127 [Lonicera macranthoides]
MVIVLIPRLQRLYVSLLYVMLLFNLVAQRVLSVDKFKREDFHSPPRFVFGSGTSAYQVEGAAFEDGRTPSIWDTYVHAGYFKLGNGDVACDGYHKYKVNTRLKHAPFGSIFLSMVDKFINEKMLSYYHAFSGGNGRGPVNPKGLQFYNNFINELISNGYDMGVIPPGRCSSPFGPYCIQGNSSWEPYMVTHNILLAHASASSLYRKKYKAMQHGMIGLDLLAYWFAPYTNATEDIAAAQRTLDFWVGWLLNPLIFGDYPDIVKKNAGRRIPVFTKDESALIQGSIDFLAVNHYDTLYVRDKSSNLETDNRDLSADMAVEVMFFEGYMPPVQVDLNPWGLQALLEYFKRAYGNPPVYIHENGLSLSLLTLSEDFGG